MEAEAKLSRFSIDLNASQSAVDSLKAKMALMEQHGRPSSPMGPGIGVTSPPRGHQRHASDTSHILEKVTADYVHSQSAVEELKAKVAKLEHQLVEQQLEMQEVKKRADEAESHAKEAAEKSESATDHEHVELLEFKVASLEAALKTAKDKENELLDRVKAIEGGHKEHATGPVNTSSVRHMLTMNIKHSTCFRPQPPLLPTTKPCRRSMPSAASRQLDKPMLMKRHRSKSRVTSTTRSRKVNLPKRKRAMSSH